MTMETKSRNETKRDPWYKRDVVFDNKQEQSTKMLVLWFSLGVILMLSFALTMVIGASSHGENESSDNIEEETTQVDEDNLI